MTKSLVLSLGIDQHVYIQIELLCKNCGDLVQQGQPLAPHHFALTIKFHPNQSIPRRKPYIIYAHENIYTSVYIFNLITYTVHV